VEITSVEKSAFSDILRDLMAVVGVRELTGGEK